MSGPGFSGGNSYHISATVYYLLIDYYMYTIVQLMVCVHARYVVSRRHATVSSPRDHHHSIAVALPHIQGQVQVQELVDSDQDLNLLLLQ